ncbi:hypothetical protein D3C87_1806240 [compost metagenome]
MFPYTDYMQRNVDVRHSGIHTDRDIAVPLHAGCIGRFDINVQLSWVIGTRLLGEDF